MSQIANIPKTGDFEIAIGTNAACDIALCDAVFRSFISDRHAALKRRKNSYFVRDLGSSQGTFVNGFRVGRRWTRIALHDNIYLGECPFKVTSLLLRSQQVSLQARHLHYAISGRGSRRELTRDISFKVGAGELVGILGPSGSGKTVLLNLLSGAATPTPNEDGQRGVVTLNERFSLHDEKDLLKDFIGFVPQDDILIPELTVEQSLAFSLELKYADSGIAKAFKQQRIESTVEKLGFTGKKKKQFLGTAIGSPDTRRGLSGGERRKVNIAHELIRNPLLLFLDEPTSGLSSVDADNIVNLLSQLCRTDKTTIITTIHQPSAAAFARFDKVLILNHGGRLAFFGPPDKAVEYFERQAGRTSGNRNPAEFILEAVDQWSQPKPPEEAFRATALAAQVMPTGAWTPPADAAATVCRDTACGGARQFVTLLKRNLCVSRADIGNLWFAFLQPLLVAALIVLCFHGYQGDYQQQTRDERIVYHIVQNSGQGLSLTQRNLKKATTWANAAANRHYLDSGSANRIGAVYFLLIVAALWVGIINTCREIVGEKAVLKREGRSYLRMSSYLLAKFVFFALLSSLQVGVIVLGVKAGLMPRLPGWYFWGILSLTAACATSLGLALSGLVATQRMALTAVPLLLIPQLLFGGLVRPIKYIAPGFAWVHDLMLQKWAFLATLVDRNALGIQVLDKATDFNNYDITQRLVYHLETLAEMYFGSAAAVPDAALKNALVMMTGQGLAVLLLAYVLLRIKYTR